VNATRVAPYGVFQLGLPTWDFSWDTSMWEQSVEFFFLDSTLQGVELLKVLPGRPRVEDSCEYQASIVSDGTRIPSIHFD